MLTVLVDGRESCAELAVLNLISLVLIESLDQQIQLLLRALNVVEVGRDELSNALTRHDTLALFIHQPKRINCIVFGTVNDHGLLVIFKIVLELAYDAEVSYQVHLLQLASVLVYLIEFDETFRDAVLSVC